MNFVSVHTLLDARTLGYCYKFNVNIYKEVYMTNALQEKASVCIFCGHNKKFFNKQQDSPPNKKQCDYPA
jgi:hypothetical protein